MTDVAILYLACAAVTGFLFWRGDFWMDPPKYIPLAIVFWPAFSVALTYGFIRQWWRS